LLQLCVDSDHRLVGIGRQVLMHWCAEAARRGAMRAVASDSVLADLVGSEATAAASGTAGVLQGWGFALVGRSMLRDLSVYSGE
jgi:GNAT superfamily N-acetyltransferase